MHYFVNEYLKEFFKTSSLLRQANSKLLRGNGLRKGKGDLAGKRRDKFRDFFRQFRLLSARKIGRLKVPMKIKALLAILALGTAFVMNGHAQIYQLSTPVSIDEDALKEASQNAVFASNVFLSVTDSIASIAIAVATNQQDITDALYGTNFPSIGLAFHQFAECEERLELIEALTNRIPISRAGYRPQQVQPRIVPAAMKDGIPAAIYDQIAADAAQEYPHDYSMQASKIRWQVEDYKKLHQQ